VEVVAPDIEASRVLVVAELAADGAGLIEIDEAECRDECAGIPLEVVPCGGRAFYRED
jgi:hypothetical protein